MSWSLLALFFLLSAVTADVYLHFPPGSNNRVNEASADRANANNAFDSQNNNKGGYNVPDKTENAFGNNADLQYYLVSCLFLSNAQSSSLDNITHADHFQY